MEPLEQADIAFAFEDVAHVGAVGPSLCGQSRAEFVRALRLEWDGQFDGETVGQNIGVTDPSEYLAQPLQFGPGVALPDRVQDRSERLQVGA